MWAFEATLHCPRALDAGACIEHGASPSAVNAGAPPDGAGEIAALANTKT